MSGHTEPRFEDTAIVVATWPDLLLQGSYTYDLSMHAL